MQPPRRTKLLEEKKLALEAKASAEARLKEAEDNSATLDEEMAAAVKVWVENSEGLVEYNGMLG